MTIIKGRMIIKNEGFTILELQIASFISLITLMAIMSMYLLSWRSFTTGDTLLDVYANSRNAVGWIMKDIRCAKQIVSVGQSSPYYTTTDNSVVLMVPSIDSSGNVISPYYDYISYFLDGSDMHRVVQKNSASSRKNENRVIAKYCSTLVFSSGGVTLSNISNLSTINTIAIYLPLNKVTISLSGAGTQTESITPTTIVRLRNK